MAKYPEEILRAGKSAQRVYDLAQGAELLAQRVEKKREQLEARAEQIEQRAQQVREKAEKLETEKNAVASLLLQNEQQITQAFQNWDTLTESQFRTVTKLLFRALVTNEIKQGVE